MFGEQKAKQLCSQVLKRSQGEPMEMMLTFTDSSLTRFANNTIHQNVAERNVSILVRCHADHRVGTSVTNRLDERGLDEVVEKARTNARSSAADPNYIGLAEPASYAHVDSFDQATADLSPAARAEQVGVVCRTAGERGLNAPGPFPARESWQPTAQECSLITRHKC
jgi:predicted Zn-dependent protease